MPPRHARVVVIGGGLMGCWTAFFLRRRGLSVVLIEIGAVGAQSSGVNFGNLRLQGRHPDQYPLSLRSQALWEQIETLIGEICEFEQTGHLYIAFDGEQDARLRAIAAEARDHGVESVLLDPIDIRRRWPWLSHTVTSAALSKRDATANPRLVTPSVARAAAALGAEIIEHTRVLSVERRGEGFRVTVDGDATVTCDWVVNAAGAWAPAIAEMLGETVPLFAAGPPQFVTEPLPRFIMPSVQAVDGKIIFRQVQRGNVVVAGYPRGPSDPVRNRAPVQPEKTLAGIRNLVRVVPRLACAHVIRVWSGIEGYLPDMLPVIGPSTASPRLLHAFGFCGHGFQLGPGVGDVLAEIIADGQTPTPLTPFSIARFQGGDVARSTKLSVEFDAAALRPRPSDA
jgi:sarcosine oxidase, subunit beta